MPKGSATRLVFEPISYGVGVTLFGTGRELAHAKYTPEEAYSLASTWFTVSQLTHGAYYGFNVPQPLSQEACPLIGAHSKGVLGCYSFTHSVVGHSGGLFYRTAYLSEESFDKVLKALRQEHNVVTVVRLQA